MRTHYDALGIRHNADGEQIRNAYRNLAKIYHPDFNPDDKRAEQLFQQISDAYGILSDPVQRGTYDKQLNSKGESSANERNVSSPVEPVSLSRRGAYLGRVALFALIGAATIGVPFAAFTYVGKASWNGVPSTSREIIAAQNYGMAPAAAAEIPAATPRLFVAGGQAPINFTIQVVIAVQGSVDPDATILIHGLPYGASLSAGQLGPSGWRVPVSDLFDMRIRPSEDFAGSLDLGVELRLAHDVIVDRRPLRVWWVRTPVIAGPALPLIPFSEVASVSTLARPVTAVAGRNDHVLGSVSEPNGQEPANEEQGQTASVADGLNGAFRECPFCPEMVPLEGGDFLMGAGDQTGKLIKQVVVKPFALSGFPVTVKEWRQCVSERACSNQPTGDDDTPVGNLSWDDAQQYVTWLANITHQKYRLPSEVEWEFAAGNERMTRYWWGDQVIAGSANCSECEQRNSETGEVKSRNLAPNPLSFNSMAGGVSQWVLDCWLPTDRGGAKNGLSLNAPSCREHVLRGGLSLGEAINLGAANRDHYNAAERYPSHGLRVARSPANNQQVSNDN